MPFKWGKWTKNRVFELMKSLVIIFFSIWSIMKVYIIWEESVYWDMVRNTFDQSEGRIFKSIISLEQIDEMPWFCNRSIKILLKNIREGMIMNMVMAFKVMVSQEWSDECSWFLHADINWRKLNVPVIFFWWVWLKKAF